MVRCHLLFNFPQKEKSIYRALAQGKSLWRALLSSKVGLIFVVTFFYASLSYASAQSQDVTPPTLTAFSFRSTTIDTSAGPAVGEVSIAATDNLAGVLEIIVQLLSPSFQHGAAVSTAFSPPATRV